MWVSCLLILLLVLPFLTGFKIWEGILINAGGHALFCLLSALTCLSKAVLSGLILRTRRTLEFLVRSERQRKGRWKKD